MTGRRGADAGLDGLEVPGNVSDPATIVELVASARQWVAFTDGDGDTWMFDLTFLASNWTCVYGHGCHGITDDDPVVGCCAHGAHFSDDADEQRVRAAASRLDEGSWANRPASLDDAFTVVDGVSTTAVVDGACIFLNRGDGATPAGCALHHQALIDGERPLDWKPDVCWQVPLRLDEHVDDNGARTWLVRGWERRDWGEGGADLDWWCADDATAFVEQRPVVETLRDELTELVGADAYAMVLLHLQRSGLGAVAPHPAAVPVELGVRR